MAQHPSVPVYGHVYPAEVALTGYLFFNIQSVWVIAPQSSVLCLFNRELLFRCHLQASAGPGGPFRPMLRAGRKLGGWVSGAPGEASAPGSSQQVFGAQETTEATRA